MSLGGDFQTICRHVDTTTNRHERINFYFHGVEKAAKIDDNLSWTLNDLADYAKCKVDVGILKTMTFIGDFESHLKLSGFSRVWPTSIEGLFQGFGFSSPEGYISELGAKESDPPPLEDPLHDLDDSVDIIHTEVLVKRQTQDLARNIGSSMETIPSDRVGLFLS